MPCMLTLPPAFEHASMQGISPLGGRGSAAFVGSSTSSTNSTISILIGIDLKIRGAVGSLEAQAASHSASQSARQQWVPPSPPRLQMYCQLR